MLVLHNGAISSLENDVSSTKMPTCYGVLCVCVCFARILLLLLSILTLNLTCKKVALLDIYVLSSNNSITMVFIAF